MPIFKFSIEIELPEGIDHSSMRKEVDKFFPNTIMRIQREFIEMRTLFDLESLYLAQTLKSSPFASLVKREIIRRYKSELSDATKEFTTILQFILSVLSMVDTKQELSAIKYDLLAQHFEEKKIETLAFLYHYLFEESDFDERPELVIDLMTDVIIKKLDEKTSIKTLNKLLSADAENNKLENFVQEKFRIVRK